MFIPQNDLDDASVTNNILNKFQAYRSQDDDSNNQKLLSIYADTFNQDKNDLIKLHDLGLINKAKGVALTNLANDYGITRIDNDDEFLRFELKWQILKAQTPTTMNGLKTIISVLLNINLKEFDITPTNNVEEIEIKNIPFDFNSGSHSDLKRKMLSDSLQGLLPVEWNLKDIQYQKKTDLFKITFAFGIIKSKYRESEVG